MTARKSDASSEHEGEGKGEGEGAGEGERAGASGADDVAAAWARMTKTMAETMRTSMDINARSYVQMQRAWSDAASDMATRMGAMDRSDPDVAEAWNVWRNYSAKLVRRMDGTARARREALERLGRGWSVSAAELGARIADAESSGSAMAFEGTYRAWVDFSGAFLGQLAQGVESGGRELGDLTTLWSDLTRDMGAAMDRLGGRDDAAVRELERAWTDLARTMGERVSRDATQLAGEMMGLHEIWAKQADGMGRLMRSTMRRLESELEQLARDYGGSSSCLACGSSMHAGGEGDGAEGEDEHGCAEEVARLGARVDELERELAGARAARAPSQIVTGVDDPNMTRS